MFENVNLEKALDSVRGEREKHAQESILSGFKDLFNADWEREKAIKAQLLEGARDAHLPSGVLLQENRKYELDDIKELCVKYRLRFLSTKYFHKDFPQEALAAVKNAEIISGEEVKAFMIAAPAGMFKLNDINTDPLLFAPLEDGRFYLLHQWGGDLKWYRNILFWPFAKLQNLLMTVLGISFVLSAMLPTDVFSNHELSYFNFYRVAFFVWNVAFLSGMISYFWFATNQKFSVNAWNDKFFN